MEKPALPNSSKDEFSFGLTRLVEEMKSYVSTADDQWTVKGFIDVFKNIYTISADTKIISKILEIHLFPKIFKFAVDNEYKLVPAEHQNHYPDISFVSAANESIKFAVDFKTTYRVPKKPYLCNGFTLGSHGEYFINRTSTKNITFPYSSYLGHFCLGIIYDRNETAIDETKMYDLKNLSSIESVAKNFQFFVAEKWRIASDKGGSGNTANIGSIKNIRDIVNGNGMFARLGESWFDDYWMNYRRINIADGKNGTKTISSLKEFVEYRKGDASLIVTQKNGEG